MAGGFRKDKTGAMQTAVRAGADIASALAASGAISSSEEALAFANDAADKFFKAISVVVDEDNKMFEANEQGGNLRVPGPGGSPGRGRGAGGGGGNVQPDPDPSAHVMKQGKFKGALTVAQVAKLTKDEAAEYDYNTGDGKKYLTWLVNSKQDYRNGQLDQANAKAYLAENPW
jgi:hypothetical protein